MSKSRNMECLYVPGSRANVIASAVYKQFSSLVETKGAEEFSLNWIIKNLLPL